MDEDTLQNAIDDLETLSKWLGEDSDWKHEQEVLENCIERIKEATEQHE